MNELPQSVTDLFNEKSKSTHLDLLTSELLAAFRVIGTNLRHGEYSHSHAGTQNSFGDHQLEVDVKTDEVIFNCLKESRAVKVAASEENPVETPCGGSGYSVAFDPLDGSSIVDCNFAVGTIAGIFKGDTLLNITGRDLAVSMISMYGPRVTVALAINKAYTTTGEYVCMELTMLTTSWEVTVPQFTISHTGKTFAPGNLRATADHPGYAKLVNYWIENKYTLRYSGGLVPDVYHILVKGQGVLSNASSPKAKAKLRLLFEASPIALIIEAAGGTSCVCASEIQEVLEPVSILDVVINDLDRRVGVCYGSLNEVERFKSYIFN